MICGSSSAFILAMMRPSCPSPASLASLRIAATMRLCRVKGDCQTCFILLARPRPVSCLNTSFTSAHSSSFAVIRPKSDRGDDALVQGKGRLPDVLHLAGAPEAGELLEHLVHVGAQLFVRGHQAEIGSRRRCACAG